MGFMALDSLAKELRCVFLTQKKFLAECAQDSLNGHKFILLKPLTFMNLSGESVLAVVKYFKIESTNILIIHDDLDMPFGKMRYRQKGSAGGNGGIRSIIDRLGNSEFGRLKIGIGRSNFLTAKDYVLSLISQDQKIQLADLFTQTNRAAINFLLDKPVNIQNKQDIKDKDNEP